MFIKHLLNDWQCAGDITGFGVWKSRKVETEIPIFHMKQVRFQKGNLLFNDLASERTKPKYKSTPLI